MLARREGRNDDALRLLLALFEQADEGHPSERAQHFMTMFEWSQLSEVHAPAYAALVATRDAQTRRLLDGEDVFGADDEARPSSRFRVIVEMNRTLKDSRATYELFVQLLAVLPKRACREAFTALPSIVEAGDFALAERHLPDPLARLDELNDMARALPLLAPLRAAPRLAAELSSFMEQVRLRAAVLRGLGRAAEAASLCDTALTGFTSEDMRALARRELAVPGTVLDEVVAHQMALERQQAQAAT
jgi:hypothetical protein